jgi:hypothetical protein
VFELVVFFLSFSCFLQFSFIFPPFGFSSQQQLRSKSQSRLSFFFRRLITCSSCLFDFFGFVLFGKFNFIFSVFSCFFFFSNFLFLTFFFKNQLFLNFSSRISFKIERQKEKVWEEKKTRKNGKDKIELPEKYKTEKIEQTRRTRDKTAKKER